MTPKQALASVDANYLSAKDKEEILQYPEVFYVGQGQPKRQEQLQKREAAKKPGEEPDNPAVYKPLPGDHIGFRYKMEVYVITKEAFPPTGHQRDRTRITRLL